MKVREKNFGIETPSETVYFKMVGREGGGGDEREGERGREGEREGGREGEREGEGGRGRERELES